VDQQVPDAVNQKFEDGVCDAARLVGDLYLQEGNIPQAWMYYRMLNEPGPVAGALEKYQPGESEDVHAVVEIAYHHGVHPRRGFDLILERFGICNAITTLSSQEFQHGNEARDYCIQRLVRALYDELRDRIVADLTAREGTPPTETTVHDLLAAHQAAFSAEEEFYHIDVSHLSSVVQMAINLASCPELGLARELCEYGQKLSPRFVGNSEPPFEDMYRDYFIYL